MYTIPTTPTVLAQPMTRKQVLFLTPTSPTPFPQLPLTPVPPTPRSSPTESEASMPSSSSSNASEESHGPSTPPSPSAEFEYFVPELPQPFIQTQLPSIHYILSRPSFDLSLPLPVLLSKIPPEYLNQAATSPPISSLFITSSLLPWYIHVTPQATPPPPSMPTYSAVLPCTPTAFTVRPTPPVFQYSVSTPIATSSVFPADADEYYVPPDAFITVQDIITTIHSSMHTPIKTAEYRSFLEGAKENVGRCYYSRIAQLDEKASKKASRKGALRMDVLPLGYAMVSAFYMASWDPEKGESSWGIEFGPIMQLQ